MALRLALSAVACLVAAGLAFWPQYLGRPWSTIDGYTHAHAALGVAWLLLLVAQPLLIRTRRLAAHRRLGRATLWLGPMFAASGFLLAHHRFSRMSPETFAREAYSLYLPLSVASLFAVAYGLGLWWRSAMPVHARFMASTAVLFLDPVLGRILFAYFPPLPALPLYQAITFTATAVVLLALLWSTPPTTRGLPAFKGYTIGAIAVLALFFVVPYSRAWVAFASWFRSLPLT